MTYPTMRDRIWTGIGASSDNPTDLVDGDDVLNQWIEDGENDLIQRVLALPKERWHIYLQEYEESDTFSGDGSTVRIPLSNLSKTYMMNSKVEIFVFLDSNSVVREWTLAEEVSPDYQRIHSINPYYETDVFSAFYFVEGGNYNFLKAPLNVANSIKIHYYKQNGTVDTGSSLLPDRLHELLVLYCLREAAKIDADNVALSQLNTSYLDKAKELIV